MQKELGIRNKNVRKNVMLIVTENCPLRCTYCYETFKNINKRTMSFETAKQIVDFEMTVDDNYEEVVIDFFGGEPFVNFRLIEQIYVNILVREYRCSGGTDTANPAAGNRCSRTGIPHLLNCLLPASLLA